MVESRSPFLGAPTHETALVETALKPAILAKYDTNGNFVPATASDGKARLFQLENDHGGGQTISTAFVANTTVTARILKSGDRINVPVDAATYTANQALTVSADGRLKAAGNNNTIVAYALEGGQRTAGQLTPVVVADRVDM